MQKSSLWIRTGKAKCQVYRVRYKQSKEKLCSINMDMSDANQVLPLLANELEQKQWDSWLKERRDQLRQAHLEAMIEYGIDKTLLDAADALKLLAATDPKGRDPKNRELADSVWGAWSEINKTVSAKSAWCVYQKPAMERFRKRRETER